MKNIELVDSYKNLNTLNQGTISDMKKALQFVKYKKSLESLLDDFEKARDPFLLNEEESNFLRTGSGSDLIKESCQEKMKKQSELNNTEVEVPKIKFSILPKVTNIATLESILPLVEEDLDELILISEDGK